MSRNPDQSTLSDVIAAIVSSVAHGRQTADIEVARVSRLYQANAYLQGMSVPRLRLQKVAIELPVLCLSLEPGNNCEVSEPAYIADKVFTVGGEIVEGLRKIIAGLVETEGKLSATAPDAASGTTRRELNAVMAQPEIAGLLFDREKLAGSYELTLKQFGVTPTQHTTEASDAEVKLAIGDVTESLVRAELIDQIIARLHPDKADAADRIEWEVDTHTAQVIDQIMGMNVVRDIISTVRIHAEETAIRRPAKSPDLVVEVDTEKVKNNANSGAVTRLALELTEEGLEWSSQIDAGGLKSWHLTPE